MGQTGKGHSPPDNRGLGAHPSPEPRPQSRLTLKVVNLHTPGPFGAPDSCQQTGTQSTARLHVELTSLLEPPGQSWAPRLTRGGGTPEVHTGQIQSCWDRLLPDTGSLPCSRGPREPGGLWLIFFLISQSFLLE